MEGGPALPEAELTGSLDRPKNRILIHLILHRAFSFHLPLTVGGDWSPPAAQCARRRPILGAKKPENEITHVFRRNRTMIHFIYPAPGGAKKPVPSQWENPDTLKHGYCACFRKALLLYGYSIADALRKVKLCSGFFIITRKWADCPP